MKVRVLTMGENNDIIGVIPQAGFDSFNVLDTLLDKKIISISDFETIEVIRVDSHEESLGFTVFRLEFSHGKREFINAKLTDLK